MSGVSCVNGYSVAKRIAYVNCLLDTDKRSAANVMDKGSTSYWVMSMGGMRSYLDRDVAIVHERTTLVWLRIARVRTWGPHRVKE